MITQLLALTNILKRLKPWIEFCPDLQSHCCGLTGSHSFQQWQAPILRLVLCKRLLCGIKLTPRTNSLNTDICLHPRSLLLVWNFRAGHNVTEVAHCYTSTWRYRICSSYRREGFSYPKAVLVGWHRGRTVSLQTSSWVQYRKSSSYHYYCILSYKICI